MYLTTILSILLIGSNIVQANRTQSLNEIRNLTEKFIDNFMSAYSGKIYPIQNDYHQFTNKAASALDFDFVKDTAKKIIDKMNIHAERFVQILVSLNAQQEASGVSNVQEEAADPGEFKTYVKDLASETMNTINGRSTIDDNLKRTDCPVYDALKSVHVKFGGNADDFPLATDD